jgi:sugar (glycoside-pentoside-hexuronide) transporter
MSNQSHDRVLPLKVKLGFPMANIGPTLQTLIQMYFLLYFYTNILGISGTAAATIILIARIWDFINDPLMGVLVERTNKPSKCIWWMKVSIVPVCVFMVLAYAAPNISYPMKVVWAAVTFVCLGMSQTAYSIPINTLRAKLTSNNVERQKLNQFEQVFSTILNAAVPSITMPLVAVLSATNENAAFTKLAAIYAAVYFIFTLIGLVLLKGSEIDDDEDIQSMQTGEKVKISDILHALAVNKIALGILAAQVVHMLFSSLSGSVLLYYCQYNLGDVNLMSITSAVGSFSGLLPLLFIVPLYKKIGNAGIAIVGNIIAIATLIVRFFTHDGSAMIFISMSIIEGIGIDMVSMVFMQNLMDSIVYGEWKTGKKNVPVLMSAYGIGTKIGLAFGTTFAGYIIGLTTFDAEATEQTAGALSALFHLNVTAPMLMYVFMAVIFFMVLKLEKKIPQMQAEIDAGTNPGAKNKA